jgi:hypothetical protein
MIHDNKLRLKHHGKHRHHNSRGGAWRSGQRSEPNLRFRVPSVFHQWLTPPFVCFVPFVVSLSGFPSNATTSFRSHTNGPTNAHANTQKTYSYSTPTPVLLSPYSNPTRRLLSPYPHSTSKTCKKITAIPHLAIRKKFPCLSAATHPSSLIPHRFLAPCSLFPAPCHIILPNSEDTHQRNWKP